jgi:carbon storage regulator
MHAMLIITRRTGEAFQIGGSVQLTVLGVSANQVRFGIKAPSNVIVDRQEIAERKRLEKNNSVHSARR